MNFILIISVTVMHAPTDSSHNARGIRFSKNPEFYARRIAVPVYTF